MHYQRPRLLWMEDFGYITKPRLTKEYVSLNRFNQIHPFLISYRFGKINMERIRKPETNCPEARLDRLGTYVLVFL